MPIAVQCPECNARLNAPDTAAGKKVKCPKCSTALVIPANDEEEPPVRRKSRPDDSDEEVRSKKPRDPDDEEEEEEERPKRKKKGKGKRGKPASSGGSRAPLLIGVGLAVLLLVGGGGYLIYRAVSNEKPAKGTETAGGTSTPAGGSNPGGPAGQPPHPPGTPDAISAEAQGMADQLIAVVKSTDRPQEFISRAASLTNPLKSMRQGRAVVPGLVKLIDDPNSTVRSQAIQALGMLANQTHEAIPALLGKIDDPDARTRSDAINSLGEMCSNADNWRSPKAPDVMKALIEQAAKDPNRPNGALARALGQFKSADAVPTLIKLLGNGDQGTRMQAALSLGVIGKPAATKAVPELERLANSDSSPAVKNIAGTVVQGLR